MYADDPYSFGEEARAEYEAAGSRLLRVPETAGTTKDGGRVWAEYAQLVNVEFDEKGLQNPERPDDVTFTMRYVFEIAPESQVDGNPTQNSGLRVHARQRYNLSAWKREKARGGDFRKGQAAMTQISNGFTKSLLNALDMDTDLGLTPKKIADEREAFIGQKVWIKIKQGPRKDNPSLKSEEVTGFIAEKA